MKNIKEKNMENEKTTRTILITLMAVQIALSTALTVLNSVRLVKLLKEEK